MDFWEFMSKPAIYWEYKDDDEDMELKEENRKLKMMIKKLMEKEITLKKDNIKLIR